MNNQKPFWKQPLKLWEFVALGIIGILVFNHLFKYIPAPPIDPSPQIDSLEQIRDSLSGRISVIEDKIEKDSVKAEKTRIIYRDRIQEVKNKPMAQVRREAIDWIKE